MHLRDIADQEMRKLKLEEKAQIKSDPDVKREFPGDEPIEVE